MQALSPGSQLRSRRLTVKLVTRVHIVPRGLRHPWIFSVPRGGFVQADQFLDIKQVQRTIRV